MFRPWHTHLGKAPAPSHRPPGEITYGPGWQCQAEGLGLVSLFIPTSFATGSSEHRGSTRFEPKPNEHLTVQVISEGAAYARGLQLDPIVLLLRKIMMM